MPRSVFRTPRSWARTGRLGASPTVLALLVVVLAEALTSPVTVRAAGVHRRARAGTVVIDPTHAARVVPPGFLGLSLELNSLPFVSAPADPVLAQLIKNLSPGTRPVLRLGGQSTDWSWWPIAGLPRPPGIRYSLTSAWLDQARSLTQATDARLIVGLNLFSASPLMTSVEARQIVGAVGPGAIMALEPGNEPELYPNGPSPRATGTLLARERDARFRVFTGWFSRVAHALPASELAGPSIGSSPWLPYVSPFVKQEPRVSLITVHRYPLVHCAGGARVSIGALLSPAASQGLAATVAPYVQLAHAARRQLRVDELNSVSCGGEAGVSDTIASALWALNTLFAMAQAGVDGVNIHANSTSLSRPFSIVRSGSGWEAAVRPEYYGLLAFALAAPVGSRLLNVMQPPVPGLHVWATLSTSGDEHVVLINDTSRSQMIRVQVPRGGRISQQPLRAPGLEATSGVTLGGQSFGVSTTTGLLAGMARAPRANSARGSIRVALPKFSAVLLTRTAH